MSARQSFVPRPASRSSNHANTEHSFADTPPRSKGSIVQPQHNRGTQQEPDAALPMPHKNDSEKRSRFPGMLAKNKQAAKPGTLDHQAVTEISFSSTPGRFNGVRRPDIQNSAPLRRSSSPFCTKSSSFAPPSNSGQKFARPASPVHNTALKRTDLTISGLKDAHISTGGVLSGGISASRVGAVPVPNYESIRVGEHDGAYMLGSNKYSASKSQPSILLERIHEDLEPETVNDHEGVLDARMAGTVAPIRGKRVIEDVQEDVVGFSLSDEIEYARKVKRGKTDGFAHERPIIHPDDDNHPGIDHTHNRLQPDLDPETTRQSSPPVGQSSSGVDDLSLEAMFANMDTFLSVETFMGLVNKWSTCSMEEWLQGSEELVKQFKDTIDWVKDNLTDSTALYSRLDKQVRDRREEQAQLTEDLKRGLASARTDLIAICRGGK